MTIAAYNSIGIKATSITGGQSNTIGGVLKQLANVTSKSSQDWIGNGQLEGIVAIKSADVDIPVSRRLVLIDETTSLVVATQWSNPTTGYYIFTRLSLIKTFTILTYDNNHVYGAVVAENLTPDIMP